MRLVLFLFIPVLFSSCATMPGDLKVHESKSEGTKMLSAEPGWLFSIENQLFAPCPMKLGFSKSIKPNSETVVITATMNLTIQIESKEGLLLNIDGEKHRLSSPDAFTDFNVEVVSNTVYKESRKRFPTNLEIIRKMNNAKLVMVRLEHGDKFSECQMTDGSMSAKRGLARFLNEIDKPSKLSQN